MYVFLTECAGYVLHALLTAQAVSLPMMAIALAICAMVERIIYHIDWLLGACVYGSDSI